MAKAKSKKLLSKCESFEEYLKECSTAKLKEWHNGHTCYEAYVEVDKLLTSTIEDCEKGAMAEECRQILENLKEKLKDINEDNYDATWEILKDDPVLYLNNHGKKHIEKVKEHAKEIVDSFYDTSLSEFEVFILLCAIEIHDIGNILGRKGHERSLGEIFDNKVASIISDNPERRLIKSIAMAHGGIGANGTKDTISHLSKQEEINNNTVRTRLLAAIVRFADELADDSTRRSEAALDLGIIGINSLIFQEYSRVLHSVMIKSDDKRCCSVNLVYELEKKDLEQTYKYCGKDKYLLDEIYDRTLKMERERRYCMKFMYSEINIEHIWVTINIYDRNSMKIDTITYSLEDVSYPIEPTDGSIKLVGGENIRTGKEELEFIERRYPNESN